MRRRSPVAACGFTVVALSAVIIGDVVAAAAFDRGRAATGAAQPGLAAPAFLPASTPLAPKANAAALERFEKSWADVVRISVSAIQAHDSAGEYLRGGDPAAAAGELKKCEDTASGIVSESVKLPLDTGRHSDANLLAAIKKVGDGLEHGCKSARAYLDTSNPADFADSHTQFARIADEIVLSEALARVIYLRLGGNPDNLLSFTTALR